MDSAFKSPFKTPRDLAERHCHTEIKKNLEGRKWGMRVEDTCGTGFCNATELKNNDRAECASMFPTLQCPKPTSSKPSTMSFVKQGKEWTFNVYKDAELGFNAFADKVIPTKADEDVKTTTDIMMFGEAICIGDLQDAINQQ